MELRAVIIMIMIESGESGKEVSYPLNQLLSHLVSLNVTKEIEAHCCKVI